MGRGGHSSVTDRPSGQRVPLRAWAHHLAESEPTRFAFTVNLFTITCATVFTSVLYGFNVWINDIYAVFYGNEAYDTRNGSVVYIFSAATLASAIVSAAVGPHVARIGICQLYAIGTVSMAAGLLLAALAIHEKQLWLFAIGMTLYGTGAGLNFVCVLPCLVWFKQVGYAGAGVGLCGFSMGLWPASFAYYGTGLINALGDAGSMCVAAGIVLVVSVLAYVSIGITVVPKREEACQDSDDTARTDDEASPGITPQPSIKIVLDQKELVLSSTYILLWLNFFFCLVPDFGVKYMVSPLMNTTFSASDSEQTLTSATLLASYAVARLITGFLSKFIKVKLVYMGMLVLQMFSFCMSGYVIHESKHIGVEWFIVLQSLIGFCLGANKVIFYLLGFECFGPANFGTAISTMVVSYGVAAFVGPFCSWQTLRGFVPPDHQGSFDINSTEIYYWVSAGSTLISAIILLLVQPIDEDAIAEGRTVRT